VKSANIKRLGTLIVQFLQSHIYPLEPEVRKYNNKKFDFYLKGITTHARYKDHLVTAV
jgi:hypothetical protein